MAESPERTVAAEVAGGDAAAGSASAHQIKRRAEAALTEDEKEMARLALPMLLGKRKTEEMEAAKSAQAEVGEQNENEGDSVHSSSESESRYEAILKLAHRRWQAKQETQEKLRLRLELAMILQQTRSQMLGRSSNPEVQGGRLPANRFGDSARLPQFVPGQHVPTLALINPHSGAMAGSDILAIARNTPYYQDRFFNIIDVVRDRRRGGLMDVFRAELGTAKNEAKAMGTRPRLVSGGGDGTASFALFMVLAALRADDERAHDGLADAGNGFIWSDKEMAESFPAIAQMPLGSANDFGFTLGWGQKYPGSEADNPLLRSRRATLKAEQSLQNWIQAVIDPKSQVVNFDVKGIMPRTGEEKCDFKLAELGGPRGSNPKIEAEGQRQLCMKEAGLPVPLFVCLYFSAGFGAYMTARFQINRRLKPSHNKLEYVRQAVGILSEKVPPQLNQGLEGVEVACKGGTYFPPRFEAGNSGKNYREVGFLNINRQAGMAHGADRAPLCARACSTREPAKFNDGRMDMYRLRVTTPLKTGLTYQTDKQDGTMVLSHTGGMGKGIFFQWDGEARFAFSPEGRDFHINVRKIMNIPVLLGPGYDIKAMGDPDNGLPVVFSFSGQNAQEQAEARSRVLRYVRGDLDAELNASRQEIISAGFQCQA